MILPIIAYGDPVLKVKCKEISKDYPDLKPLLNDMLETMQSSQGVGLAAPQIGKAIRIFWVDTTPFGEDEEFGNEEVANFSKVFINAKMISETGKEWVFNEGCLSIPNIREDIKRHAHIEIEYFDENFELKREKYSGIIARVIQHEYDHIEGKLFIDYLSAFKKKLINKKLTNISKGKINVDYRMKFPLIKGKQ
ncbi:MAG: peptide deformylase [Flavobacteriales bacterium]